MLPLTATALINLIDKPFNGRPQSHPDRSHNLCPGSQSTEKEITMNDHCGHNKHATPKTEATPKTSSPTPVKPDPHAGHDMGKSKAPAAAPKPGDKK